MEKTQLSSPVKVRNVAEGKHVTVNDQETLDMFLKKKGWEELKPVYIIQYWDDEHGWMFVLPLIEYKTEKEADDILIEISKIFPKYRFRNHEIEIVVE